MSGTKADACNAAVRTYLTQEGKRWDRERHGDTADKWTFVRGCAEGYDHCIYCGSLLDGGRQLDHIIPVNAKYGGLHCLGNVLFACKSCNSAKGGSLLVCDGGSFDPLRDVDLVEEDLTRLRQTYLPDNFREIFDAQALIAQKVYQEVRDVLDRY